MVFIRLLSSISFLSLIVLFIPLTFDIGGRDAGLAYTLSLSAFYFVTSCFRAFTPPDSRFRKTVSYFLRSVQWFIIPSLAIWALSRFSLDDSTELSTNWVERTFNIQKEIGADKSLISYIFGSQGLIETLTISTWDKVLRYSSPVFQLLEGFCSLLVIQATGQLTRFLVNRSSSADTYLLGLIVSAAATTSASVYFLWRVLQFPDVSSLDSTLIGIAIASAIFLCAYGVVSGKGTAVESSLLFAYIVLCIYQIFTDYKPNSEPVPAPATPDFPPFPPAIMSSYSAALNLISAIPDAIIDSLQFTRAAFSAVTPSVLVSLGYRLFVFYASTRIIPAIQESGISGLASEPSMDDSNPGNRFLAFLSWFSPSILIAVYTSLLMQHFATTMGGYAPGLTQTVKSWWSGEVIGRGVDGNLWKWVNLAGTLGLYAVELWLGDEMGGGSHWKSD